jgi:hypothetical protein
VTVSNHVSYAFTLVPAGLDTWTFNPNACYYYDLGGFPVRSGDKLTGTISVDTSSTFYIMTVENLNLWTTAGQCYVSDYELMSPVSASSPYSFTWTPQTSATYGFLIVSYVPGVSGSFEADSQFPQLTTSTSFVFYTSSKTSTDINSATWEATFLTQVQNTASNFTLNPTQSYAMLAVLVVVLASAFLIRQRRRTRRWPV